MSRRYVLIPMSYAPLPEAQATVLRSVRERNHLDSFAFTQEDLNAARIVESDGFGRLVPPDVESSG